MNAMSLRSTSWRARAAVLAVAALLATASVIAAEVEKRDAQSQAETERKLEDARRRLDAAAREVAELSMSMSEHAVPSIRHFTRVAGSRAMVGINIGAPACYYALRMLTDMTEWRLANMGHGLPPRTAPAGPMAPARPSRPSRCKRRRTAIQPPQRRPSPS